jgi:putative transposase
LIDQQRDHFPVRRLCQVLDVSVSGYYAWRDRPPSAREMANRELMRRISAVYQRSYGTYGSPRVYHELRDQGCACSENRIARLMRLLGLQARQPKRFKATTRRNKHHPVATNLLQRDFAADRPNRKWLVDISYIPTLEGWLYLAAVLDLYARRVVGWGMAERMTSALTKSALRMALQRRRLPVATELIHHSDQGSQYTDVTYRAILDRLGIQVSMNGAGTWYDNAPMESFFGTLKSEWVHHRIYQTRDEARTDIFFYIEAFYNRYRRHSSLDYLSPEAYEQRYYRQQAVDLGLSLSPQN